METQKGMQNGVCMWAWLHAYVIGHCCLLYNPSRLLLPAPIVLERGSLCVP
jgi:hypothetical protein